MASSKPKLIASPESKGTMGDWKARKLVKGLRASRSTGKSKGLVPDALARYMCRSNRSYKHPLYGEVMARLGSRKKSAK